MSIYSSFIFAGLIHGFFLSVFILTFNKERTTSSLYLGLFILIFSLSNLQYALEEMELISWQVFNYIFIPWAFLTAPFLYFFVMYFLYPKRKKSKYESLLFLPFLVLLFFSLIYKFIVAFVVDNEALHSYFEKAALILDTYGDFINIPIILAVLILLLVNITNYEKNNYSYNLKTISNKLFWLKGFLIALFLAAIIWMIYSVNYAIDDTSEYYTIYIIESVMIYLLGYVGIYKIGVDLERKSLRNYAKNSSHYPIYHKQKSGHIISLEKILIEDKKFLDPEISQEKIAQELNLSKSHLSRVFNSELNVGFSDYVNNLRIEEAQRYLVHPDFNKYTLAAIGLESGFNSKSSFNTSFKKVTGMTPSQYKKAHLN